MPLFEFALHGTWLFLKAKLLLGIVAIRQGNVVRHQTCMLDSVIVTAAPAFYRAAVAALMLCLLPPEIPANITSPLLGQPHCTPGCVHEAGILMATLLSMSLFTLVPRDAACYLFQAVVACYLADIIFVLQTGARTANPTGGDSGGGGGAGIAVFSHAVSSAQRKQSARLFNFYALGVDWH